MKIKLFAGLLAALLATAALGQTYSIFSPGPAGPVKSNGSFALQQEFSSDIIGLWTGTCSLSTFLRGDGACANPVAGSNTQIQFNNSGVFGASSTFTFTSPGTLNLNNSLLQGDGTSTFLRNASGTGSLFLGVGATNYWQVTSSGTFQNNTVPTTAVAMTVNQNSGTTSTAKFLNAADTSSDILFGGLTKGIRIGHSSTGSTLEGVDSTGVGSFQPLAVNGSTLSLGTGSTIANRLTIGTNGNLVVNAPVSGDSVTVNSAANARGLLVNQASSSNSYAATFAGAPTAGSSLGARITAGTNNTDFALSIQDQTGATNFLRVFGDGGTVLGGATSGDLGLGTINTQGCFVNGVSCLTTAGSANPTASVGLAAVNGAATTFMRSDAAPALDQTITPTWTAQHTFSKVGSGNPTSAAIYEVSTRPTMAWDQTTGGTDAKKWYWDFTANHSTLNMINDAETTNKAVMDIQRSGNVLNQIIFGNATDFATSSFTFDGDSLQLVSPTQMSINVSNTGTGFAEIVLTSNSNSAVLCTSSTNTCGLAAGNNVLAMGNSGGVAFYTGLTKQMTVSSGAVTMPNLASSSAATTGTMCWTSGTGNITIDTTTTCLASSIRFKQDVRNLDVGLHEVMQFRPVSYQLKPQYDPSHLGRQEGLIAEEVQKIDPRLVSIDKDGKTPRGVRYQQLTAVLIKAIQEQQAEIQELRTELKQVRKH